MSDDRVDAYGPDLLDALDDPDAGVRGATANALAFVPALASRSLPRLRTLAEGDGYPAYEALGALDRLDPEASVPLFEAALSRRDPLLRYRAVAALGRRDLRRHAARLFPMAGDEDAQVRRALVQSVSRAGGAEIPVDALLVALERGHADTRPALLQALGAQGARAAGALPALERWTRDPAVGSYARNAIERIRGSR
jgi:HEAT repeat protein